MFQCPLGLIPHFYKSYAMMPMTRVNESFNALSGLYLISTAEYLYDCTESELQFQCPLGLIPRYPFKNLGFMRFPEPVFAGIYQNILTAAVFRAC